MKCLWCILVSETPVSLQTPQKCNICRSQKRKYVSTLAWEHMKSDCKMFQSRNHIHFLSPPFRHFPWWVVWLGYNWQTICLMNSDKGVSTNSFLPASYGWRSLFTNFDYGASHWDKLFEGPPENISIVEKQNFKESEIFYKLGLRGRLMGLHIELLSGVWAWDDDDGDDDDGGNDDWWWW